MFQQILVVVLVVAAAAFSVWKLMPARRRLRVLLSLDAWAATHPRLEAWRERSLKPRIARAGGTGCDGCAVQDSTVHRTPR
ncbi:MAG TPA: DUF6587 family protein [Steroidobacteraceae bacterium]|nr:DUF6587 family protein [Steroidobacteraceae bacterium]